MALFHFWGIKKQTFPFLFVHSQHRTFFQLSVDVSGKSTSMCLNSFSNYYFNAFTVRDHFHILSFWIPCLLFRSLSLSPPLSISVCAPFIQASECLCTTEICLNFSSLNTKAFRSQHGRICEPYKPAEEQHGTRIEGKRTSMYEHIHM